ncbi:MAG: cell division protein ZapB [Bacteriovoracaceae bacterium]|jgi:hypothetical protein|nr:cell division protein ZapB [Bacteriovoracaceae bacterium]
MYTLLIAFVTLSLNTCFALLAVPNLDPKTTLDGDNNSTIDPRVDYERFSGRVTDKSDNGRIIKVKVENNNTKFFKAADKVYFTVNNHPSETRCTGNIRKVEDFYFVMYVTNFDYCWDRKKYFPRGVVLNFESKVLAKRVFEAAKYREILLLKKDGFLSQLSKINNYLWTYDTQRVKVAADYDERINELKRQKARAIDNLIQEKQEKILLQQKLRASLNRLDSSLDHYKVERQEYLLDRWNMDHDNGLPFTQRPLKLKDR